MDVSRMKWSPSAVAALAAICLFQRNAAGADLSAGTADARPPTGS